MKKKLFKRLFVFMLLLVMVLNLSFPVQAQSTKVIDIQLKKQGAPQYLIDVLPKELKFKIYSEGLIFESCKKETKTFYNENITSNTGDVSIMDTIPSTTLELIPSYSNIEPHRTNDVYAWGYVGLKLIRRFPSDGTKEQYFTTYLHKKIVPTVSLSLSNSSVGIGISGVGSYDTLATCSDLYDY